MVTTSFAVVESAMIFFGASFVRKPAQACLLKPRTAQARVEYVTDVHVLSLHGMLPTLSMPRPRRAQHECYWAFSVKSSLFQQRSVVARDRCQFFVTPQTVRAYAAVIRRPSFDPKRWAYSVIDDCGSNCSPSATPPICKHFILLSLYCSAPAVFGAPRSAPGFPIPLQGPPIVPKDSCCRLLDFLILF